MGDDSRGAARVKPSRARWKPLGRTTELISRGVECFWGRTNASDARRTKINISRFRQSSTLAAYLLMNGRAHAQRLFGLQCLALPATPLSRPSPSYSRLQWSGCASVSMWSRVDAAPLEGTRPGWIGRPVTTALARKLLPYLASQYLNALRLERMGAGHRHSVSKRRMAPRFFEAVRGLPCPTHLKTRCVELLAPEDDSRCDI